MEPLIYVLVGVVVVGAFAAFWIGDRKRNRNVESDKERLHTEPDSERRSQP